MGSAIASKTFGGMGVGPGANNKYFFCIVTSPSSVIIFLKKRLDKVRRLEKKSRVVLQPPVSRKRSNYLKK